MLDPRIIRRHRRRNLAQAVLLIAGMFAMLGVVTWLLVGPDALWVVTGVGVVVLVVRPRVPPRMVLAAYRARPVPASAAPGLHRVVRVLSQRAGLPAVPELHYVASPLLNAFAVGRPDDAAIAVTDGLLRGLTDRELIGVLAHEISHVRSDDLWVMSLSDTLGRLTHALAYSALVLVLLAAPATAETAASLLLVAVALTTIPTLTTVVQLALSRSREYDADVTAAALTGDPDGLAVALRRLERAEGRLWERTMVPRRRAPDLLLLRTHPPTEERVRRLRELRGVASTRARLTGPIPPPVGPEPGRSRLRLPGGRW